MIFSSTLSMEHSGFNQSIQQRYIQRANHLLNTYAERYNNTNLNMKLTTLKHALSQSFEQFFSTIYILFDTHPEPMGELNNLACEYFGEQEGHFAEKTHSILTKLHADYAKALSCYKEKNGIEKKIERIKQWNYTLQEFPYKILTVLDEIDAYFLNDREACQKFQGISAEIFSKQELRNSLATVQLFGSAFNALYQLRVEYLKSQFTQYKDIFDLGNFDNTYNEINHL